MKNKERIIGLDLIRTMSFIAVAFHHFAAKLWYSRTYSPFVENHWYWKFIEIYARLISFSGFTILLLTSFLVAFTAKNHEKAQKLVPLMLFVWLISSLVDVESAPFFLTWDIFPLIALGLAMVVLLYKFLPFAEKLVPLFGFILLLIPFWQFAFLNDLPLLYKHILVGDCQKDIADWPILPWVGLILLAYGLGKLVKNHFEYLKKFTPNESRIWFLLLAWTPFFWGRYYSIILGDKFSCEVSTQAPIVFMAHMLPVIFMMRLSLIERIRFSFHKYHFLKLISNLQINQKFGMAYILHLLIIDIIVNFFGTKIYASSLRSYFCTIAILPLTELILIISNYYLKKFPKEKMLDNKIEK